MCGIVGEKILGADSQVPGFEKNRGIMAKVMINVLRFVIIIIGVIAWQHFRYLKIRRDIVQDRQPMLYGADTFHVVTFIKLAQGKDIIESLSMFAGQVKSIGLGKIIYAGQAVFTNPSAQIGESDWDAVMMVQYPSRKKYEAAASAVEYQSALNGFSKTYTHGMRRPAALNLILPQVLLVRCLKDILKGNWRTEKLEPAQVSEVAVEAGAARGIVDRILSMSSVNDKALVIFNLTRAGTPEQQASDRIYTSNMLTRMARLSHGPMHMGSAVILEGDAKLEDVSIVYYPGPRYFAELVQSRFFQGIIGSKQLGDSQSVPTVPVLSLLE